MSKIQRSIHDVYPFISYEHNLKDIAKGKTLMVTGAGSGVGQAIARHFAAAGATRIVVGGRTLSTLQETKKLVKKAHPHCTVEAIPVDVADAASVEAWFSAAPFVPDVLVNNVGICHSAVHIADSDPATWWRDMAVNVQGVYLGSRAYLRALAGKPGTIINVSSSTSDMPDKNMSSYSTAKLAVNRFTEILHAEYGAQGVRAYAFHPGGIRSTGMGSMAPEQYADWLCDTVDLAAGMALYLSAERAEYLRGRFVYGAWDMEKVEAMREEILAGNLLKHKLDLGDKLGKAIVLADGRVRE